MSKFLITGGAGFIGSHLVELLLAAGHEVIVLDDLSTGKASNLPKSVSLVIGDIANWDDVNRVFRNIDGCFHLAAIASVEVSQRHWRRSHQVNACGIVNIFEAARLLKTPIVYASSAAIYGNNPNVPLNEDQRPNPENSYGIDKYFCELAGRMAFNVHGIPNIGVRFFNVYGPRQDPSSPYAGVISIFLERIRKRQVVNVFGDGTQVRDFIYVTDAVKILWKSMERLLYGKQKQALVVNACTKRSTSLNTLIKTLGEILGQPVIRRHLAPRVGDIHTSIGNSNIAQASLGVEKSISLRDGLNSMLREVTNE